MAAAIVPKPASIASGPVWPIKQLDAMMTSGRRSRTCSQPIPQPAMALGENDSTITSAQSMRSQMTSSAAGFDMSRQMPRLPAFMLL